MIRARNYWAAIAWIAMAAGCTMCDHPYDYCGPTAVGRCGQPCSGCMGNGRAGSILSPGGPGPATCSGQVVSATDEVAPDGAVVPDQAQRPTTPSNGWTARQTQATR